MNEKTARTWTPRLGLELPDVFLPDIRDDPILATKSQTKSCELGVAKEFASECEWLCEWNGVNFVVAAETPCEWKFATKFASDCECDGLVHSASSKQSLYARLPLIDVAFFSMAMASLNNDVAVGLGLEVEVQLRNRHAAAFIQKRTNQRVQKGALGKGVPRKVVPEAFPITSTSFRQISDKVHLVWKRACRIVLANFRVQIPTKLK